MSHKKNDLDSNPMDLIEKIRDPVLFNQSMPTGEHLLVEIEEGIIHEYFHDDRYDRAERFIRTLDTELDWIERFVHHAPTIGNHYECVLRDLLKEYLPSSVKIGTGFIYDSQKQSCSPQLDIITYSDINHSPLHRRGEFVIVDPDTVIGMCEVKKKLSSNELRSFIKKTINLNLGNCPLHPVGVQRTGIYTFKCDVSTDTLVKHIIAEIELHLGLFITETKVGDKVYIAAFQLALPTLYIHDRDEYISVSVSQDQKNPPLANIKVSVLKCPSGNAISPFLLSMNPRSKGDPKFRDFISDYLIQIVSETTLKIQISLMQRIGSTELVQRFPDAKAILSRKGVNREKVIGATCSSFVDIDSYSTLDSFSNSHGFNWQVCEV